MSVVEFTVPDNRIRPLPQLLHGSRPGGQGFLLARRFASRRAPMFVVTPEASRRDELIGDLTCFVDDPPDAAPEACGIKRRIGLRP